MGFPPASQLIRDEPPCFRPCQIVCLQHETSHLYAEVIQVIESRHLCWVRPLVLILAGVATSTQNDTFTQNDTLCEQSDRYDLRQDSDLLLPLTLFRAALDSEVLPWLTNFYANDRTIDDQDSSYERGHVPFRQFIQQVCQAHATVFQNRSDLSKT